MKTVLRLVSMQIQLYSSAAGKEKKMKVFKPTLAAIYTARKAEFQRWKSEISNKLKNNSSEGPVYLGDKAPFPSNPSFKPFPVLSTTTRNHIFATWESDKVKWTPKALASTFKVSIERIGAIIKQKCLEKEVSSAVKEGKGRLFQLYASKMDQILGAGRKLDGYVEGEGAFSTNSIRFPPKLIAIPENSQLSSEEAAALLERKLYVRKDLVNREIESMKPISIDSTSTVKGQDQEQKQAEEKTSVISRNREEASRWKYYIHDISNKSNSLLVRESNGILRYASTTEKVSETVPNRQRIAN